MKVAIDGRRELEDVEEKRSGHLGAFECMYSLFEGGAQLGAEAGPRGRLPTLVQQVPVQRVPDGLGEATVSGPRRRGRSALGPHGAPNERWHFSAVALRQRRTTFARSLTN